MHDPRAVIFLEAFENEDIRCLENIYRKEFSRKEGALSFREHLRYRKSFFWSLLLKILYMDHPNRELFAFCANFLKEQSSSKIVEIWAAITKYDDDEEQREKDLFDAEVKEYRQKVCSKDKK